MGMPYAEVIGDPIAHSRSPLIHRFWLEKRNLRADYRAVRVREGKLRGHMEKRRNDPDWLGSNLTMPHKQAAIGLVDRLDEPAEAIGAVNTVKRFGDGSLGGTNTDADGFGEMLGDRDLAGQHAVLIGAGGAARAVLLMLKARRIGWVTVINRNLDRAIDLLTAFGGDGTALSWTTSLPAADLAINATPLGMNGTSGVPFDLGAFPSHALVCDLIYDPSETMLLRLARKRGLATRNGLGMLIGQAALAFEIFFNAAAPREHDFELRALLAS